jgi:hypothetical protein
LLTEKDAIDMRRVLAASALMVAIVMPASADEVPTLNVDPLCRGIAAHATAPGEAGTRPFIYAMRQSRTSNSKQIGQALDDFFGREQGRMVGEATAGGLSSYADLLTCLQMARDVEQMRQQKRSWSTIINEVDAADRPHKGTLSATRISSRNSNEHAGAQLQDNP